MNLEKVKEVCMDSEALRSVLSDYPSQEYIMKWLTTKWTIFYSFLAYVAFIVFHLYPTFATLVPAGLLMGLGTATVFCAKNAYVSMLAEAHSMISNVPASEVLLSFSGFFYTGVHMSQFWGNFISSLVLSSSNNASVTTVNETMIPQICGSNFLPKDDTSEALPAQPFEKILTLVGIYLACIAGAALLIAVGLDPMKRYEFCRKSSSNTVSGFKLLAVNVKHLRDMNQQLILAVNIFIGLEQAFFFADFTASFVSCAIGTGYVGYVLMTYGASNVVGCFVNPYLAKRFGRVSLICFALFVHGGILLTLLLWSPHVGDYYVMVTIALLWGVCDAIWTVQINTYYGVLFRGQEEAAYSNLGLWEGVGNIIAFSISTYVRTFYKLYLVICMLILGVSGYLTVVYRQHRRKKREENPVWTKANTSSEEHRPELERLTH